MLAEYRDFWPLTVRQVYYRLIGLGVKPKTKRGDEAVGDALNRAKHADDPDFATFAALIAEQGYTARFEGIKYRYLRVDDYLYWLSRSLFTPGRTSTAGPQPTWRASPSTSRARSPSEDLTRDLTSRDRVASDDNP